MKFLLGGAQRLQSHRVTKEHKLFRKCQWTHMQLWSPCSLITVRRWWGLAQKGMLLWDKLIKGYCCNCALELIGWKFFFPTSCSRNINKYSDYQANNFENNTSTKYTFRRDRAHSGWHGRRQNILLEVTCHSFCWKQSFKIHYLQPIT